MPERSNILSSGGLEPVGEPGPQPLTRKESHMRFAASSIVREAISHAILGIQLWQDPDDMPMIARTETLQRYFPVFQDEADTIASDVYDWFLLQGRIAGDICLQKRRLFLELWKDERFEYEPNHSS